MKITLTINVGASKKTMLSVNGFLLYFECAVDLPAIAQNIVPYIDPFYF